MDSRHEATLLEVQLIIKPFSDAARSDSDFLAVQYLEELACRMMKTAGSAIDTMKKMHHVRRYIDPILIDMALPGCKGAMRWSDSVHNLLSCPPLRQAAQPTFAGAPYTTDALLSARSPQRKSGIFRSSNRLA
jgi:hypothetical protein